MKLRILILAVALLAFAARSAVASTSSCNGAGDGTACVTTCISSGICMMNVCVPVSLRLDGTACSTDNRCTFGDTCLAGECIAGSPLTCPDFDACRVGFCSPLFGCSVRNICRPDMAASVSDMGTPPTSDMAVDVDQGVDLDMGAPDDLTGVPNDMCFVPPGAEFYTCNGADGPYYIPFDASMPADLALPPNYHVRGSRIGDCAFGGGSAPAPSLIAILFAAVILIRRRTKRVDR